ncbi:hypothetical protein RB200_07240 [Streptomyces sp. PmtG]
MTIPVLLLAAADRVLPFLPHGLLGDWWQYEQARFWPFATFHAGTHLQALAPPWPNPHLLTCTDGPS